MKGDPSVEKKIETHNAKKKLKGGHFSLALYCMIRGKIGKTFLVQFPEPTGTISIWYYW